ncbi:MAG TPA: c-type cytochrome [Kofleriaceae bacterium]|jgi:mono/diheme cytochrome c family protein|nr:c-type cytochrome [Kofleriaceae bacterium]
MKSWLLAVVVAVAAPGAGACNRDPAGGTQDGASVFGMLCATCHGPDGRPPAAMVARLGVRDLTAPEFRARVAAAGPSLVEQQVRHGSQNKLMPAFEGAISDAQIRAVAAFVASPQFVQPAPPAAPR